MLVVETIARIRRAHFVQGKSIKAICRELRVSRKVVRKVLRSEATEFRYEREQQPMPRLGAWRDELDRLLAANEARPSRERLTLIRVFEALRASVTKAATTRCGAMPGLAARSGIGVGIGLCAAELRARRGLPVRLEPRGRADQRHDRHGEGCASAAVPQPDAVRASLPARDAGDGVRRA